MDLREHWVEKPRRVLFLLALISVLMLILVPSIPLGYLPRPVKKTVMITIEYRGAFEREIERTIVNPLEEGLSNVRGITEIFSIAEKEKARIVLTFSGQTDLDEAFLAVREIVYAACTDFPPEVQRPVILNSDPLGAPVFIAGFPPAGSTREEELKRIFENVEGSGEILVAGERNPQVVVCYDSQRLAAAHLGQEDLIRAVRGVNVLGGFAPVSGQPQILDNRFRRVEDLQDLRISPGIRLRDVAVVAIENRREKIHGRVNGRERLILYVHPEGDANVLELCSRLERLTAKLPDAEVIYSHGRQVRRALSRILYAAAIGVGCVVLLTSLFIRRLVPAALVSANIPFAVLLSLAALRIAGEQLDVLSLSGIVVGAGLVIDAGVVFIDEFFRSGSCYKRTVARTRSPILFASATTAAVFLPLLFAPQPLVDQFRGLALSITASVAASCLFVFGFLPVFLHNIYGNRSRPMRARPLVQPDTRIVCLRRLMVFLHGIRIPILISFLVFAALTVLLTRGLNRGGMGYSGINEEMLQFSIEYPSGYTADSILDSARPIEKSLMSCSHVKRVSSRYEPERASFVVQLDAPSCRDELLSMLRSEEEGLGEAFLHFPQGFTGWTSIPIVISGTRPQELERLARDLAGQIRGMPQCEQVLLHFKEALPARELHVDLEKTARAGVVPSDLYAQMRWALSAPVMDKWTTVQGEMDIILRTRCGHPEGHTLSELLQSPCGSAAFPLADLVRVGERPQTGRIYHLNRTRSVRLSVLTNWEHRRLMLDACKGILAGFPFPPGYRGRIGGEAEEQRVQYGMMACGLALAVLLILFVLMFQFESLRLTGIIAMQIPGAFIFPLLFLKIFSWSLTLPVFVGLILTSGIAVNNAILVFADLRKGPLTGQRIARALERKLRALLVSSLTTIAGVAPLLLSGRANQGILAPLSITVAAGIAGSIAVLIVTCSVVAPGGRGRLSGR